MKLPPRLRQRGITQREWNKLNPQQQREAVRKSDALARRNRERGEPATAVKRRRIRARAKRLAALPKPERGAFYIRYQKEVEDAEFWREYQEMTV